MKKSNGLGGISTSMSAALLALALLLAGCGSSAHAQCGECPSTYTCDAHGLCVQPNADGAPLASSDGTDDGSDDDGLPSDPNGGLTPPAPPLSGYPASCDDARARGTVFDGILTIDPDGDKGPIAAFGVYCAGMPDGSKPAREYIELTKSTFVRFAGGGYCDCGDFVRTFTKVRLDPKTMHLVTDDFTFSTVTSSGTGCNTYCQGPITPLGSAGSCMKELDATGTARLDLDGTSLSLAPSVAVTTTGWKPGGAGTIGPTRKLATLTGGGACGWTHLASGSAGIAVVRD